MNIPNSTQQICTASCFNDLISGGAFWVFSQAFWARPGRLGQNVFYVYVFFSELVNIMRYTYSNRLLSFKFVNSG